MEYASSSYCRQAVNQYVARIDEFKADMWKNFYEMDLSNASIQAEIQEVDQEMSDYCETLKSEISSIHFY